MRKLLFIGALLFASSAWAQQGAGEIIGCVYNSSPATLSDKQSTSCQFDASGNLKVVSSGTPSGTQNVNILAAATGGCTPGKTLSAASTNSTSVTGAASTLCYLNAVNTTTTIYYLKLYNKATAPTCNSDTVVHTEPVPPASAAGGAGGIVVGLGPFGSAFSLGIGFCLTAGIADNDNASAATGVAINYGTK